MDLFSTTNTYAALVSVREKPDLNWSDPCNRKTIRQEVHGLVDIKITDVEEADLEKADRVSSLLETTTYFFDPEDTERIPDNLHAPVIDFDIPIRVAPSTTEGHFHLFIDYPLAWENFLKLLKVLSDTGLIEAGYYNASLERGYTAVRLPWVKKVKDE